MVFGAKASFNFQLSSSLDVSWDLPEFFSSRFFPTPASLATSNHSVDAKFGAKTKVLTLQVLNQKSPKLKRFSWWAPANIVA